MYYADQHQVVPDQLEVVRVTYVNHREGHRSWKITEVSRSSKGSKGSVVWDLWKDLLHSGSQVTAWLNFNYEESDAALGRAFGFRGNTCRCCVRYPDLLVLSAAR